MMQNKNNQSTPNAFKLKYQFCFENIMSRTYRYLWSNVGGKVKSRQKKKYLKRSYNANFQVHAFIWGSGRIGLHT